MASLLLNLTPMVVGITGIFLLDERPITSQWFGIGLATLGVGFYFLPISLPQAQVIGVIVAIVGVLANAGSSLLGREINRYRLLSPLLITFISMGVGSGRIGALSPGWRWSIQPLHSPCGTIPYER
jgi:drug/metabolite transporter (DMT)-like permease